MNLAKIKAIANARTAKGLLAKMQMGFELETQSTENRTYSWDGKIALQARMGGTLEVVEDSSVSGFEFRTRGGNSRLQFEAALGRVFGLRHSINSRCSFHIHLSVPGIKHKYAPRLQHAVIAYLAAHRAEMPATVRTRWESDAIRRYCRVQLSEDKYSFVHWHHQGTIEFRCFGNVRNERDALKCLDLAARALQYAYRCKLGLEDWPTEHVEILRDDITGLTASAA